MAVSGSERNSGIAWQTNRAETSMRLGLARLENPADRDRVSGIIADSQLPELAFFARTLATNPTEYAVKSLGWALGDAKNKDIPIDPGLVQEVQARLKRAGR